MKTGNSLFRNVDYSQFLFAITGIAISLCVSVVPTSASDTSVGDALCDSPASVRLINANIGHYSLRRNKNQDRDEDRLIGPDNCRHRESSPGENKENFIAAQSHYFRDVMQIPGQANIFAMQEVGNRNLERGCSKDWPSHFHVALTHKAEQDQVCKGYDKHYKPFANNKIGQLTLTSAPIVLTGSWHLNNGDEDFDTERTAQATFVRLGPLFVWIVNTHLEYCHVDENDFSINLQNLNGLISHLQKINGDHPIIVTGDMNIHAGANTDQGCIGENFHPRRYRYMQQEFSRLGFRHVIDAGVDHVFIKDPYFRLRGYSSRRWSTSGTLIRITDDPEAIQRDFRVSDHPFITIDINLTGEGISPALIPILVNF